MSSHITNSWPAMKRHHHLKLPEHLYLSPPSPQPSPATAFASAASLFATKAIPYTSPAALIQDTSLNAFAVGDKIPGFRTSAAFFTTLRANINLDIDSDSQFNTPDSLRPTNLASSVSSLLPPDGIMADTDFAPPAALDTPKAVLSEDAPSADEAETKDPNYIPPLTTVTCDTNDQQVDALKLVADSVAQQRQLAARAVIFHPVTLAIFIALGASIYQYFYNTRSDLAIIGTTFVGVIMIVFASVRAAAGPYIDEAERVGTWVWLDTGRTKKAEEESGKAILGISDEMILSKFGDEPIGAIVFRGVQPVSTGASPKKGKKSATTSTQTRTEIRGWTVHQKYRHKGVGTALLEDAIKVAHEKGWASGGIEFAADHANSKKVLPAIFNAAMEQRAQKARTLLQKKVEEYEATAGKGTRKKR